MGLFAGTMQSPHSLDFVPQPSLRMNAQKVAQRSSITPNGCQCDILSILLAFRTPFPLFPERMEVCDKVLLCED